MHCQDSNGLCILIRALSFPQWRHKHPTLQQGPPCACSAWAGQHGCMARTILPLLSCLCNPIRTTPACRCVAIIDAHALHSSTIGTASGRAYFQKDSQASQARQLSACIPRRHRASYLPAMTCRPSGGPLPPCWEAPGPNEPFGALALHDDSTCQRISPLHKIWCTLFWRLCR